VEAASTNLVHDPRRSRDSGTVDEMEAVDEMETVNALEPVDELDGIVDLGDQIATLAAHLHAATYRLLTLIAEFDRLKGWEAGGHRTCAHWLAFRTGIDLGAAREKVRAARALTELPQISATMEQGELSFAQVRALTRVATPESEGDLLELARCSTAAQLERTVRAWRRMSRCDENELERIRHRSRYFSVFPDEEGMYLVRGRLDPEVGAMLMRAIDAANDVLFRADTAEEIEPKQRRADALGLLAERGLAAGFGGGEYGGGGFTRGGQTGAAGYGGNASKAGEGDEGRDGSEAETGVDVGAGIGVESESEVDVECESDADADGAAHAEAGIVPLSGTRAERYQVVLHVEAATLEHDGEPGRSELEDGTRVSAETSRRLSCDASVIRLSKEKSHGVREAKVLDVGRKTRTIPPALRRALEARDRGCRFPGCGLRFTDAHHVTHWADGGATKLDNLVLLCRFHHRLVHEDGYTVHFPRGERPYFLDPRMRLVPDRPLPPPHVPPEPVETLLRQNRCRGVDPGFFSARIRYKREADIPLAVVDRALRALEGPG